MTDTIPANPEPNPPLAAPADSVMDLLVTLLAPLFHGGGDGGISLARMAAGETLSAYRARTLPDLLLAANVVAFSLGALGSLGLSMAEAIALPMTLRLRGNANGLNRAAGQNRRALEKRQAAQAEPVVHTPLPVPNPAEEAALIASVAATQRAAAEAQARLHAAARPASARPLAAQATRAQPTSGQSISNQSTAHPATTQPITQPVTTLLANPPHICPGHAAPAQPPAAVPPTAMSPTATPATDVPPADSRPVAPMAKEQLRHTLWAKAMADVAAEFTASLAGLPPNERHATAVRAAALTRTANTLLAGDIPPADQPFTLNHRTQPAR